MGVNTAFCKYQKRDPEMLDIHESHKMMKGGCLNCERSDVAGLVLECSGAPMGAAKPTFPVDSSHETKLIEGTWTCTFCSGTDLRVLKHACPRVPKSEVAIHTSHDIGESGYCVNCAKHKTMDVYMEKPCPKFATAKDLMDAPRGSIDPANAVRRRVGLKKFEPPKGTILVNDIVWMLYYWDHGPMIVSIHASAQQAVEANTDNHSIGQWKLDTDFREAVKQWESRSEKKDES